MLGAGQLRWGARLALGHHNPRAHEAVIRGYEIQAEISAEDYDAEVLTLMVSRGLVHKLVDGPLYQPCLDLLISQGDTASLEALERQLSITHPPHAAALRARLA